MNESITRRKNDTREDKRRKRKRKRKRTRTSGGKKRVEVFISRNNLFPFSLFPLLSLLLTSPTSSLSLPEKKKFIFILTITQTQTHPLLPHFKKYISLSFFSSRFFPFLLSFFRSQEGRRTRRTSQRQRDHQHQTHGTSCGEYCHHTPRSSGTRT